MRFAKGCWEINFLPTNGFSTKPLEVKLSAGEQKATKRSSPPERCIRLRCPRAACWGLRGQGVKRRTPRLVAWVRLRCGEPQRTPEKECACLDMMIYLSCSFLIVLSHAWGGVSLKVWKRLSQTTHPNKNAVGGILSSKNHSLGVCGAGRGPK